MQLYRTPVVALGIAECRIGRITYGQTITTRLEHMEAPPAIEIHAIDLQRFLLTDGRTQASAPHLEGIKHTGVTDVYL